MMSSFSAANTLYQIAVSDNSSDLYMYGIPTPTDTPQVLYRSIKQAMSALLEFSNKFEKFIPVAYGEAYPYEDTTFEVYLHEKGAAPYGWVIMEMEPNEPPLRVGIFLIKLQVAPHSG
jgi:hypothetical protein